MYFGISHKNITVLAYECAAKLGKQYPNKWNDDKLVGIYWMRYFMRSSKLILYENLKHNIPVMENLPIRPI